MSCYLVVHRWTGSDAADAAQKLARVFRIDPDEASDVVKQLEAGTKWRFENQISDAQADKAQTYLTALGFEIQRTSLDTFINLEESKAVASDDEVEEEAEEYPAVDPTSPSIKVRFTGTGAELFKIFLKNFFYRIITLGIYGFWAKTHVRRFLYSHTLFAGDEFTYHGTGEELCKGWFKAIAKLILIFGGLTGIGILTGLESEFDTLQTVLFLLAIPYFLVGAWRYRMSRTSWRGIHFSFQSDRKSALKIYIKGWLLTVVTLGLYYPFFMMETEKFWRGNCFFGNEPFEFSGEGKEVMAKFYGGMLLTIITLGLYFPWYLAFITRYKWEHTRIGKSVFHFNATGFEFFKLDFVNALLIIVTLGIALPWVTIRNRRFLADHLTLIGKINLNRIVQDIKNADAQGDEALDVMDADFDFG